MRLIIVRKCRKIIISSPLPKKWWKCNNSSNKVITLPLPSLSQLKRRLL